MDPEHRTRGLFGRLDRFVLASCRDPDDAECRRQARVGHGFAITGITICLVFLVAALVRGDYTMLVLVLGLTLVSVGSLIHQQLAKSFYPSATAVMLVFGAFLIYMLATGGVHGTGSIWVFIFPPMVVYSIGYKPGLFLAGGFLVAAAVIVYMPEGVLEVSYPPALRNRLLGALIFVTAATLISERSRQRAQQRLVRENQVRQQAEADLHVAKEQAELAAQVKGEFLANMSHELRTPLTTVVGMNQLLLDAGLDEDQRQLALTIKRSGEHLVTIINDILDLSKLEADQLGLEQVTIDPRVLTEQVVGSFEVSAKNRGLNLALQVEGDLPAAVRADPGRLRQVLDNLLSNAIKFTEQGRVEVGLSQLEQADGRVGLRWTVEDSGIGIDVERHADIFDPFVQADGSTTRHYGGTGLGLSIIHRLVMAMGGRIGLESEPGRGSTFWFELDLPRGDPSALVDRTASTLPVGEQIEARLLVVEDDPTNQTLLQMLFDRLGATVVLARDGQEAVAEHAEGSFDLILMDCHMPRMDGFQATEAIRKRESDTGAARVPIVAVTASATEENWRRCIKSGMDDCLVKPFEPETLEHTVRRWIRAGAAIDEGTKTAG